MGRKSSLTKELHDEIVQNVLDGMPRLHAVTAAGVSVRTLTYWLTRYGQIQQGQQADTHLGRETDEAIVDLMEDIDEAEAKYIGTRVRSVNKKLLGQFSGVKDDVLWLERRFPEWFRKRETTEIIGNPNAPLQIENRTTPEEELERNANILAILADRGIIPRPITRPLLSGDTGLDAGAEGTSTGRVRSDEEVIDAEVEQVHPDNTVPETDGVSDPST